VPLHKDYTKVLALIILVLWIIEGKYDKKTKELFNSRVIVAFTAFIIYSYISIFWSDQSGLAFNYVNKYIYYFIIPIMYTSLKKEYIHKLLLAFFIGMLVSEIITYGIYLDLWTTSYNEQGKISSPTAFMGHSAYSLLVVFTVSLTLNKILFSKNSKIMITFYIVLFLFTFGNILISGGRTGLLSLFVIMFIFSVQYIKNIKNITIIILSIILLLFMGYKNVNIFKSRIDQSVNSIEKILIYDDYESPIGIRVALIRVGLEIFQDNILFGVGIKDNITQRVEYASVSDNNSFIFLSKWAPNSHFHNEYIEIVTSIGFIGLALFLYFIFTIYRINIKSSYFRNIKNIFIIILIFGITTTAMFHQRQTISLFALFIGLVLLQNKYEQEKQLV